jgi:hypothetical protein
VLRFAVLAIAAGESGGRSENARRVRGPLQSSLTVSHITGTICVETTASDRSPNRKHPTVTIESARNEWRQFNIACDHQRAKCA